MMDPIYGSSGEVVAWHDGTDVLNLHGQYIAFINNGSLISYRGDGHIGWFEDGVLWDSQFLAIGMLRNNSASLPKPGLGGTPGRPGRPGIPGTPGRPGRSNSWSNRTWDEWAPQG